MTVAIKYSYAPDGVTVEKRGQPAPRTARHLQTGRIVSGIQAADLPDFGYFPERVEPVLDFGNGLETVPVIDVQARESVYRARPVTEAERVENLRASKISTAEAAKRGDLNAWVAGDPTGTMVMYDISPERRADYLGLPGLLDAADAADTTNAPHSTAITVRPVGGDLDNMQVEHTAAQVRALLQIGAGYMTAVYQQYHQRLDAIAAASTMAELEAIDIPIEGII